MNPDDKLYKQDNKELPTMRVEDALNQVGLNRTSYLVLFCTMIVRNSGAYLTYPFAYLVLP